MTHCPVNFDVITRPTLGLVVLQSDETIEPDFRRLLPPEAAFYVSRVPNDSEVSSETLGAMAAHLPASAGLFPRGLRFDAVGYGCTSGTSVIGPARIAELVREGATADHVSEPVSALVAACEAIGVRRLAFLSPYVEEVSDRLRGVLAERGIETPVFGSFNVSDDSKVVRISGQSIIDAATRLGASEEVEAVFLSCTNLRTLDVIAPIAAALGKPVLSSNQVLAAHLCRLAGLDAPLYGL